MATKKKQLATYLFEEHPIYQAVLSEAEGTGMSRAGILRLALRDRYAAQRTEREQKVADAGGGRGHETDEEETDQ